ncbi:MAG TPA: ribosome maturation factor RimM [Hyphomicrobiales bacterium]|nr:ribosome maturation factor RimM [Hyphomicrobiales bacterium]
MPQPDRILVGVFGAPHGVRGAVRLKSYTQDPRAILGLGPLDAEDGRAFGVTLVRPAGEEMLIVRVAGIADRDAAAALTNTRLYVPRSAFPQAADGEEFYYADLLGLPVESREGEPLGSVVGVEDFGAGDLLEIAPAGGGPTAWLPFTRAFVPVVDLVGRRLVAAPPVEWGTPANEDEEEPA